MKYEPLYSNDIIKGKGKWIPPPPPPEKTVLSTIKHWIGTGIVIMGHFIGHSTTGSGCCLLPCWLWPFCNELFLNWFSDFLIFALNIHHSFSILACDRFLVHQPASRSRFPCNSRWFIITLLLFHYQRLFFNFCSSLLVCLGFDVE